MKAFIVYKEDYPWDVRVEKLALSLAKKGVDVTIICQNLRQDPTFERSESYNIKRLPRFRFLPSLFRKLFNLPLWFNPFWLFIIYRAAKNYDKPIIIVRDLPLVKSAVIVSKATNAKVIFDMAEVYPEMYDSSNQYSNRDILTRLYKNPSLALRYENSVLPNVDHTLVMIEESRDRLLDKGIPSSKVSIVSNTPALDKFDGVVKRHEGDTLFLVYVGFLTRLRGLDLLISAAHEMIKHENNKQAIFIDIVGKGEAREELQNLVSSLGLGDNVKLHGWLKQKDVNRLMARANVGALTYRVCGHWNHTIPNKIFDYMLAGLPVLATPVIPIKRIVENTQSGIISRDATPIEISKALIALRDSHVRQRYGKNGYEAVVNTYNWSSDEKRLHDVVFKFNSVNLLRTSKPSDTSSNQ